MQIAIDTGGTFTDCLALTGAGTLLHCKIPSTPHDPAQAVLSGIRQLMGQVAGDPLTRVIHGSTVATNALLEGRGGSAVLIVPRGFEDLLILARQNRPDLYALEPRPLPPPLPRNRMFGLRARLNAQGAVLEHWDDEEIRSLIDSLKTLPNLSALGICLLHGYRYPALERELREALRAAGIPDRLPITCSHELSTVPGEYERAVTVALNARLLAPVGGYLQRLESALLVQHPTARLEIVCSNGDALPASEAARTPVRLLLSGPAGGVQFGQRLSAILNEPVITLDIGGTSSDCACLPGPPALKGTGRADPTEYVVPGAQGGVQPTPLQPRPPSRQDGMVGGYPVRAPMLDLETVGAGGGSIIWLDAGGALQVGPQSAGADPGPACYGIGDFPTLTDAHLVLGHLPLDQPLGGTITLDPDRARASFAALIEATGLTAEDLATGAIAIADTRIANGIRAVSTARGHDPSQFTLVAMGGAGGLHAVGVAERLGIRRVCIPPLPGLASAQGLAASCLTVRVRKPLALRWPLGPEFVEVYLALMAHGVKQWNATAPGQPPSTTTTVWCRYFGQDAVLPLPIDSPEPLNARFHALHEQTFGFSDTACPIELTAIEIALSHLATSWPLPSRKPPRSGVTESARSGPLGRGSLIVEDNATTWLPEGATAQWRPDGLILIDVPPAPVKHHSTESAAIELTLANDLLASIAEEMALALEQSAHSSNIKDRRDLSTALFDSRARLVAQGAHIPVHLGSMQASVEGVLAAMTLTPGQTAILNSPYHGGTHLPDITLVTCLDLGPSQGLAYLATRAHHADIGGAVPGSMPLSDRLEDEGILIPPTLFATDSVMESAILSTICGASRQPDERRGDLIAQLGANQRGARRLRALVQSHGEGWWPETCQDLIAYDARMAGTTLSNPGPCGMSTGGQGTATMESDGTKYGAGPSCRIEAQVAWRCNEVEGLSIRFDRSSRPAAGPINCPAAVTLAAITYVIRCLCPLGTPTNAGLLTGIAIDIPEDSLINARYPAPTAAGNVETSQKIVEALMVAFSRVLPGLPAPSQGTMNNILIGGIDPATGKTFTYYETVAGGCGAGPHGPGASALHSHMTNSRNTPIEMLESRFPLLIDHYSVRPNSGGQPFTPLGFPGGDGVQRAIRFLANCTLTLIADWPEHGARGAGKRGTAFFLYPDDSLEPLPSKWSGTVAAGTVLLLSTPGGWGWDPPNTG